MRASHSRLWFFVKTPDARRARARRVFAAALAAAFFLGGCAHTPEGAEASAGRARVRILNLSGQAWRVALDPEGGPAGEVWELAPRGEHVAWLAAGDYRMRQSPAGETGGEATTSGEPVRLAAGGAYTWPLATLLSLAEEPGAGP